MSCFPGQPTHRRYVFGRGGAHCSVQLIRSRPVVRAVAVIECNQPALAAPLRSTIRPLREKVRCCTDPAIHQATRLAANSTRQLRRRSTPAQQNESFPRHTPPTSRAWLGQPIRCTGKASSSSLLKMTPESPATRRSNRPSTFCSNLAKRLACQPAASSMAPLYCTSATPTTPHRFRPAK